MIIDIHTHVPPESSWPLFVEQCRANDVGLAVVSSLGVGGWPRYPTASEVRGGNAAARDFVAFADGLAAWFAYINPQNENWQEELTTCLEEGAVGIKLWISLKDPETGSLEKTHPVLAMAGENGLPVLIHTFHRTDENLPGEVTVAEFADLARAFPTVTMIAAHAGCNWRQCLGLLKDVPNAVVDICGGYPETGMVEALVDDLGVERVLYGSDAIGRSMPSQIAKVTLCGLSEYARHRVLFENSAALLGLGTSLPQTRAADEPVSAPCKATVRDLPDASEDHFCFCGHWPFRRSSHPTAGSLEALLAEAGIERAYTGGAETVFAWDVLGANEAFAEACKGCSRIIPLATLQPFAPNWRPTLDRALLRFEGGILFPYLHNWRLDDPVYDPFFAACADAGLPLWINGCTADLRFRHRGTVCRPVSADELAQFAEKAPPNRYVFQGLGLPVINAFLKGQTVREDVRFEISRLTDNTNALTSIIDDHGTRQLVFGSEFPFRHINTVRWTAGRLCGHH